MKLIKINITLWILSLSLIVIIVLCFIKLHTPHPLKTEYDNFIGKAISFSSLIPMNSSQNSVNKDSLILASPFKVVIYVDSSSCEDCSISSALGMRGYQIELRERTDIQFIYIFNTSDLSSLNQRLLNLGFYHYYFADIDNIFTKVNNIPASQQFHTFLLEDNKVKVIGSPILNTKKKKSYNKAMSVS